MRDALFERPMVLGVRRPAGNRRPPGRPRKLRAAVEDAVLGPYRGSVFARASIRARRMAGDQIVDFEAVLDPTKALLERLVAAGFGRHLEPPLLGVPYVSGGILRPLIH